jgi:hypothetical protein
MRKFPHVEDYLEIINGDKDPATNQYYGIFGRIDPVISLARYDVRVINSMATGVRGGQALTDRQAELACKLILKYRRQLAGLGIDVSPVESPQYRMQLRSIDRRRLMWIDQDHMVLQFSFEPKVVDLVRDLSKESKGSWRFVEANNKKQWHIALTEPNFVTVLQLARENNFEIDAKTLEIEQKIQQVQPYRIELDMVDEKLSLVNAPDSLLEFVQTKAGNITTDNLIKIVDLANVCHFAISPAVEELFISRYKSTRLYNLLRHNHTRYNPDIEKEVLDQLFVYAEVSNRFPIHVYEPDLSDRLRDKFVLSYFNEEDVLFAPRNNEPIDTTGKKVVYFTKYRSHWPQDIPLLVTSAGMMHGAEKTLLLQRAEKVVFFAAEVYNTYKGK